MRPQRHTYPDYYENYIPLIEENNVCEALTRNWQQLHDTISHIAPERERFTYEKGKWTVQQLVQHITDTERVISYRALRFARQDPRQPLPFDENAFALSAELGKRGLRDQLHELGSVRQSTLTLFETFSKEVLLRTGNTFYGDTTVLALGYLIAGHARHHLDVLRNRYI